MVFVTLTNGPLAGPPEVEPNKPPLKRPPLLELVEPNLSIQEPSSLNPAHPPPKSRSASPRAPCSDPVVDPNSKPPVELPAVAPVGEPP